MPRIFLHSVPGSYENLAGVPGIEIYSARALTLVAPTDAICLPEALKPFTRLVMRHQEHVGLGMPYDLTWTASPEVIPQYIGYELSVFKFTHDIHAVSPDAPRLAATEFYDDKNNAAMTAHKLGVPWAPTQCFATSDALSQEAIRLNYPLIVKGANSASGQERSARCRNRRELEEAVRIGSWTGGRFQIQECLEGRECSVLLEVLRSGKIRPVATTYQVIDGDGVHQGNFGRTSTPNDYQAFLPLVEQMAEEGFLGYVGFDAFETPNGIVGIECNARTTAGCYYSEAAQRLGFPAQWYAENLSLRVVPRYEDLEDLLVRPEASSGLVICNWPLSHHKVTLMAVGPADDRQELWDEFVRRFGAAKEQLAA